MLIFPLTILNAAGREKQTAAVAPVEPGEVKMIDLRLFVRASGIVCLFLIAACDLFIDDAGRIERAVSHIEAQRYRAAEIDLKNVLRSDPQNVQARVLLGKALLLNGSSAAAVKELTRAGELGADAAQYMPPLARALLREGRHNDIVELDASAVDDDDERAVVLALIGRAESALGNNDAASARFEQALALSPVQNDALLGRAQVAASGGEAGAARANLEQLLANHPDDRDGLAALGRLLYKTQDYAGAESRFARALQLTPEGHLRDRMLHLAAIIDAQLAQGKNEEARDTVAQMLEVTEQHPLALLQAARVDYSFGDYDSVVTRTQQIIAQLPEFEPARLMLAAAAIARGDRGLAATQLQTVVNTNPGNDYARKLLAQVHMDMGSPGEALTTLQPLLESARQDPQSLAMAGSASLRTGQQQAGLDLLERSVQLGNDDPAIALQSANALIAAGELDRAIAVLESLPDTDRVGQRDLLLVLARLQSGDKQAARAHAQSVLDARPGDASAHRLMGGYHLAAGEFGEARTQFEAARGIDPEDQTAIINLARIDIAEGNPDRAEQRFRELLGAQPDNLMALTALAQIAEQRGDRATALKLVEQSMKANPEAPGPPLRLARFNLDSGNLELAGKLARQAVRNAPNQADTHRVLGLVLLADKRPNEALSSFERAVELAPGNAELRLQLGRVQEQLGRQDAAFASFETALKLDSGSALTRAAMAAAHLKRGDTVKAEELISALVRDFPDRAEPLILRGDLAAKKGDAAAALAAYDAAAAIAPSRVLAATRVALRRELGRDQPMSALEQWVQDNPDDTMGHKLLAQAYLAAQQYDRAIEHFEAVMPKAPDAATAINTAIAHERNGDLDSAVSWLQRATELEPELLPAQAALSSIELRRGNTDRAVQIARKLREQNPDSAEVHQLEGAALGAQGKHNESAAAYSRAAAIEPTQDLTMKLYAAQKAAGNPDAWRVLESWLADHPNDIPVAMQLAMHYDGEGLADEAIDTYRRVLYSDPDNFIVLNNLAWVYYKRGGDGDIKRGINSAQRAYKIRKDVPAVVDTYGWLLLQDGRVDEALNLLRSAADGAADDPEINYHYAVALSRSGDKPGARQLLDRVLAAHSDFDSRSDAEALRGAL